MKITSTARTLIILDSEQFFFSVQNHIIVVCIVSVVRLYVYIKKKKNWCNFDIYQ